IRCRLILGEDALPETAADHCRTGGPGRDEATPRHFPVRHEHSVLPYICVASPHSDMLECETRVVSDAMTSSPDMTTMSTPCKGLTRLRKLHTGFRHYSSIFGHAGSTAAPPSTTC